MPGNSTQSLSDAVSNLSAHISTVADAEQEQPLWRNLQQWLSAVTRRDWSRCQVIEAISQALVCMDAHLAVEGSIAVPPRAWNWLQHQANPFWQQVYQLPVMRAWLDSKCAEDPDSSIFNQERTVLVSYEHFLAGHDPGRRTAHGVFYTPSSLVRWIVREVAKQVRKEFPGMRGIAPGDTMELSGQEAPGLLVDVLDPAAGTGVFLVEVIDQVACEMKDHWRRAGMDEDQVRSCWNAYVPRYLLPRLTGFELLLPAAMLGQLAVLQKLAETGFEFRRPGSIQFHVMDTLAEPLELEVPDANALTRYLDEMERLRLRHPFTVILGNPPFSGVSRHEGSWISALMRGQCPLEDPRSQPGLANYYEVDGEPLGERKVWLQDDYVKFLRYCHWKIEQADRGVLGLVTNHGYLDGPSFRGLRQSLCTTFPRMRIVDLHGNQKKKECAPDGGQDENVFSISAGVAVGFFLRGVTGDARLVEHRDLWGRADQKIMALEERCTYTPLQPSAPHYFLLPHDQQVQDEYLAGFSLCDVMQQRSTAAVTARDGLVVGFNEAEILERLEQFRDGQVTDGELRQQFFARSRSAKYPPGDTRSWKLTVARAKVVADVDWKERLQTCFYRPFDRRAIYWAPWMVDWPRTAIMKHMLDLPNLALVARRQMLPSRPCNFFWVTDGICLDGMIRSDNRGTESLFPLYLADEEKDHPRANMDPAFVKRMTEQYQWQWQPMDRGNLETTCGPLDVFHMIYAQFHSRGYRERYASWLRIDFPRIFLPKNRDLFRSLVAHGSRLVQQHLMRGNPPADQLEWTRTRSRDGASDAVRKEPGIVAPGFPRHDEARVWINPGRYLAPVPRAAWNFEVGGYQVCRKWLMDRRGRLLTQDDQHEYACLVSAVLETIGEMDRIDQLIEAHGGWPAGWLGTNTDASQDGLAADELDVGIRMELAGKNTLPVKQGEEVL